MGKRVFLPVNQLKIQMTKVLFQELKQCHFQVEASFAMAPEHYLFDLHFQKDRVSMRVNLGTVAFLLRRMDLQEEACFSYCGFYMARYIGLLWQMKETPLEGYARGLAAIKAIHGMEYKKKLRVIPPAVWEFTKQKPHQMGVLEVLCDADALVRLKTVCRDALTEQEKERLDAILKKRMLFLELPEVTYLDYGTPKLAIGEALRQLKELDGCDEEVWEKYPILRGISFQDDGAFLESLGRACLQEGSSFWRGLALRMAVTLPMAKNLLREKEILDVLLKEANDYQGRALRFCGKVSKEFESAALLDDFDMVCRAVQGIHALSVQYGWMGGGGTVHTVF